MGRAIQKEYLAFPGGAFSSLAMGAQAVHFSAEPQRAKPEPEGLAIDVESLLLGQDLREMGKVEIGLTALGHLDDLLLELKGKGMTRRTPSISMV
jgi:hypothetical protein